MLPPQNPAGPYEVAKNYDARFRDECMNSLARSPEALRSAVAGLDDAQLDTLYRNWSIRQIVYHLADSHVHSYIRFKWALTEDRPTIKPYDENRWAGLADARAGNIAEPLALYTGLHATWVQLLRQMTADDFARTFHHPESQDIVPLDRALGYYSWHARHHTAQIVWLREQHAW